MLYDPLCLGRIGEDFCPCDKFEAAELEALEDKVDRRTAKIERKYTLGLSCDICPPNRGENTKRTPRKNWKFKRKIKYKIKDIK